MTFNWSNLFEVDFAEMFKDIDQSILVHLNVLATKEKSSMWSVATLVVKIDLSTLYEEYKTRFGNKLRLNVEAVTPFMKKINWESFKKSLPNASPDLNKPDSEAAPGELQLDLNEAAAPRLDPNTFFFAIKPNTTPNTVIAQIKPFINNASVRHLPDILAIESEAESDPDTEPSVDPTALFSYDSMSGNLKLVRQLDANQVNSSIRFRLIHPNQGRPPMLGAQSDAINVNIMIEDVANKNESTVSPKLAITRGLIVVCVSDNEKIIEETINPIEKESLNNLISKNVTLNSFRI